MFSVTLFNRPLFTASQLCPDRKAKVLNLSAMMLIPVLTSVLYLT